MKLTGEDKKVFGLGAWVFALFAVLLAFGALWVAGSAMNKSEDAEQAAATGGSGAKASLTEFAITPATLNVETDGTVAVSNDGTVVHNLVLKNTDKKTKDLQPGESESIELGGLKKGHYTIYCAIPGHEAAGMSGHLYVGEAVAATEESGSSGASAAQLLRTNKTDDETMKQPVLDYVAQLEDGPNTKGIGNQPLPPTVLPDGTKEFRITGKVVDWEVSPGQTVKAWAYGPTGAGDDQFTVPGPWLKVDVGDKVKFVFTNKLPQSTGVHFHGVELPNSMDGVPFVTQDPILPGKTFTYEFVANRSQVSMYHSHHHAEHQVPDGQLGIFQIGEIPIPDGLPTPARVEPMVLNDAGVIGLTLNGKSFPATLPIMAKPGETVRIDYFNEGLVIHPMHLHGITQTVVAKDGYPVAPYELDTLNVAPGERYSVLITPRADQAGVWAYHCHILTHAERADGMFGMVTTVIVQ